MHGSVGQGSEPHAACKSNQFDRAPGAKPQEGDFAIAKALQEQERAFLQLQSLMQRNERSAFHHDAMHSAR